jgi:hypothetical protein
MPQIRCPKCGTTINLENRKGVDFSTILNALQRSPKTFTDLLHLTGLPRKTLSLRLKSLCDSGAIVKDGGYRLNGTPPSTLAGKETCQMLGIHRNWKKFAQVITLMFIISTGVSSLASALMTTKIEAPPSLPPVAAFSISPDPPYYMGWPNTLTFTASSSYDPDSHIISYKWSFFLLEGRDSSKKVGDSEGITAAHVFDAPGRYEVVLTVTDNEGKSASERRSVSVLPVPCSEVYVDLLDVQGLGIGNFFTVGVAISNVTDLFAWQVGMTFNPNVLEFVKVNIKTFDEEGNIVLGISAFEEGPFLKQGGETIFVAPSTLYKDEGIILPHGCSLFPEDAPVTPQSGSGTLAYITFKVVGQGNSALHLTDVTLLNSDVQEIPVLIIEDGYFQSS